MLARFALIAIACSAGNAQSFEVASVKPAMPLGPMGMRAEQKGGPGTSDPGIFICRNCTLYWVLADAYKIHSYDFSGPDWLQSAALRFLGQDSGWYDQRRLPEDDRESPHGALQNGDASRNAADRSI